MLLGLSEQVAESWSIRGLIGGLAQCYVTGNQCIESACQPSMPRCTWISGYMSLSCEAFCDKKREHGVGRRYTYGVHGYLGTYLLGNWFLN